VTKVATRTVQYEIHYAYPYCFETSPEQIDHDLAWGEEIEIVEARTDREAQRISLEDRFWKRESCRHGRSYHTTKIVKRIHEETADEFVRDTEKEISRPKWRQCACGLRYWPVLDQRACHELVKL